VEPHEEIESHDNFAVNLPPVAPVRSWARTPSSDMVLDVAIEDPADQAMRLTRALDRRELAGHRLRDAVGRRLGVRDDELLVLRRLAVHGDAGQAELAALTGLSRSGAGALLQRLEQLGLIERHTHPADRRARRVRLTDAARRELAAAHADLQADVAALLDALAASERATVERFVGDLAELAERRLAGAAEAPQQAAPAERGPRDWTLWG
jgi:DNA-binding MarR family transcriptional regulator